MRNSLIFGLAGAVFCFAASGSAFAADLNKPVYKAPPPPPPAPVYSWTGWYVGGNIGYGWGDANTDVAGNGNFVSNTAIGNKEVIQLPNPIGFSETNTARLKGVIGGGQFGYNYQFSPTGVVGFETDFQGSGERGSGQLTDPFGLILCSFATASGVCTQTETAGSLAALTSYQAKIDWFGTVRGRLGILIGDQLLVYGTGGLAYGEVSVSGNSSISGVIESNPAASNEAAFSSSKTNVGYSVGGGIEGRLAFLPSNWTWKLEYLYLDLGSLDTTTQPLVLGPALNPNSTTITTHTHFTDNIVRVGLNYQFH